MASQGLVYPAADGKHVLLRSVLTPFCAVITIISLNTHPKGALLPHLYCHGMPATRLSGSSRSSGGGGIRICADEIDAATVHLRAIQ
jgi:hypothetical protein